MKRKSINMYALVLCTLGVLDCLLFGFLLGRILPDFPTLACLFLVGISGWMGFCMGITVRGE